MCMGHNQIGAGRRGISLYLKATIYLQQQPQQNVVAFWAEVHAKLAYQIHIEIYIFLQFQNLWIYC